jgi:hypothetical protein
MDSSSQNGEIGDRKNDGRVYVYNIHHRKRLHAQE